MKGRMVIGAIALLAATGSAGACSRTTNTTVISPTSTTLAPGQLRPLPSNPSAIDLAGCARDVQAMLDALTDVDLTSGIYPDYADTACRTAGPGTAQACVQDAIDIAARTTADQASEPPQVTIPEAARRGSLLSACAIGGINARRP